MSPVGEEFVRGLGRIAERIVEPKFLIAFTIIAGFGYAYAQEPDETMKGALIAGFAGAWGYYLGSSNSSNHIRDQMDKTLDLANRNTPKRPPDVTLEPGETAQASTRRYDDERE